MLRVISKAKYRGALKTCFWSFSVDIKEPCTAALSNFRSHCGPRVKEFAHPWWRRRKGGAQKTREGRETETSIYHKGKAEERMSTERTSGDISVKNSRQGQLKWGQKWWMRFSRKATNLVGPSLLLQEKNPSLAYLIMETAAAPGSRQGFHIKH